MAAKPEVRCYFHAGTGTWQYLVFDPSSLEACIIDPVLDFDITSSKLGTETADELIFRINELGVIVTRIMETHAHADHLTASRYIQQKLAQDGHVPPDICIGKRIKEVQSTFAQKYGINPTELENVFDHLFDDDEHFKIGKVNCSVLYLPGHTPDHIGYMIGDNVFTGDSIFNPDVGSARCDFPNGSATDLYRSMSKLLSLPGHIRLYTGHDYPPETRTATESGQKQMAFTTVEQQNESNKHVKRGTPEASFVKWRSERDATLGEPRLLHRALQINIRAGRLPPPSKNGDRLLNIPIKEDKVLFDLMDSKL
ncbi:Metallo-hydrolase/oxidoreductase [Rhizodiscina lignyota]|uniref:Metallo-hydrolase/oxidoreductase n=1 Tax=Rhizodiscina lignyota TaxID=1504668 RepID=A0A9P4M4I7_9PEZI|nr:Metallo-hydrolase/oxidoreductase [Rhizodiscina lignyota]